MTTLVLSELNRLGDLEAVIERGLSTFVDVGEALREIREARLYRQTHGTFEDYCRERWSMTRQHANRLVGAAGVVGALEPMGSTYLNERQARELAPLLAQPEKLQQVWERAPPAAARTCAVLAERGGGGVPDRRRGGGDPEGARVHGAGVGA